MRERFEQILDNLSQNLYERDEHVKKVFLATMAGESAFLLGPPGVAKSLIARRMKTAFKDATSFEYLMNRFSTPEEIFGPISISKLRDEDVLERKIENYLPSAHIAFLDEIWKAGPSIQNTLLTIINEKIFRNGTRVLEVPLIGLIAASNELPAKGQGLEALWDRFIIRLLTDNISDNESFAEMITDTSPMDKDIIDEKVKLTFDEYHKLQKKIDEVVVPDEVIKAIHHLRMLFQQYNDREDNQTKIYVSDRRWKKIIRVLRTSAFINGRSKVDLMDAYLIADMVWDEPGQIEDILRMVRDALSIHGYSAGLDLVSLDKQIEALRKECEAEMVFYTYEEYEELKRIQNDLVKIVSFNDRYNNIQNPGRRIYLQIPKGKDLNDFVGTRVPIYDINNNRQSTVYVNAVVSKNELQLNDGRKIILDTMTKKKANRQIKKPHPILVKAWNEKIEELTNQIEETKQKLKETEERDLKHLKTNLFVPPEFAEPLLENIRQSYVKLEKFRHQLDEIKFFYTNPSASEDQSSTIAPVENKTLTETFGDKE